LLLVDPPVALDEPPLDEFDPAWLWFDPAVLPEPPEELEPQPGAARESNATLHNKARLMNDLSRAHARRARLRRKMNERIVALFTRSRKANAISEIYFVQAHFLTPLTCRILAALFRVAIALAHVWILTTFAFGADEFTNLRYESSHHAVIPCDFSHV